MAKFKKNRKMLAATAEGSAAKSSPGLEAKVKKTKKNKDKSKVKFEQKMKKKKFKEQGTEEENSADDFTLGKKKAERTHDYSTEQQVPVPYSSEKSVPEPDILLCLCQE